MGGILAVAAGLGFAGSRLTVAAALPTCTANTTIVNCTLGGFEIDGNTVSNGGTDWQSSAVFSSSAYTPFYDLFNSTSDDIMSQGSKESDQTSWQCVNSKAPGKSDLGGPSYTASLPSSDSGGDPGTTAGEFAPKNGKSWAGSIWFNNTDPGQNDNKQFLYSNFQRFAVNGDVHLDIEFNKATALLDGGSGCPTLPVRSQGDLLLTYDTSNGGAQIFISAFVFNCTTVVSAGTPCPGELGSFAPDNSNTLVPGGTFAGAANISPAGSDAGVTAGAFGEAGLNLTDTIGNFTCGQFGKTYMRTRSAGTSDIANGKAEVKDFTQPVQFNPGLCPTSTLAKFQADETTQGADAQGTDESGATDMTADAALTYNNKCSLPANNSTPASCANGASTTPMGAAAGDELSYKLVYKNTGGGTAPNPVVTDTIPTGTTYVAGSQSCPASTTCIAADAASFNAASPCASTNGVGTITTLVWCLPAEAPTGAGAGVALYFEATLPLTQGTSGTVFFENFAHVTDTQASTDTASNSNYVAATAVYTPHSGLAKKEADVQPNNQYCNTASGGATASNAACASLLGTAVSPNFVTGPISATPGDVIEYQLTYTNTGDSPATGVVISDSIPSGSTYVAGSAGGADSPTIACLDGSSVSTSCTATPTAVATVTWTYASVAVNGSEAVTFKVKLASTATNGTVDSVSNSGSVTTDQDSASSNTVVANITGTGVLGLVKSASVNGTTITYTIKVFNTGNGNLTNQTITDVIPAGLTFTSCSGGNSCSNNSGTVTWSVDVPAGTTETSGAVTLTLVVHL